MGFADRKAAEPGQPRENVPSAGDSPFVSIAIVGCGKMGEAMLAGWLAAEDGPAAALGPSCFTVVAPGQSHRARLSERYGVACVEDASRIEGADLVVLAVKPQVMPEALEQLARSRAYGSWRGSSSPLFVSVAAGLPTSRLATMLPPEAPIVRVMPNTPLMVGQGASVVAAGPFASPAQVEAVLGLFGALGLAEQVEEGQIDAVCALSGGGPAYVAALIEALTAAGAAQGLDAALAERLVVQTVAGTCTLMEQQGLTPEQARIAVCSPGGTTLAALQAMDDAGFAAALSQGVDAAVRRAKELAS